MTDLCQRKGCTKEAIYYPELRVAPYGHPIETGIVMQFGLKLCGRHIGEVQGKDLVTPENQKKMSQAVMQMHNSEVPLDFNRTKVVPRKIGDDKWQLLTQNKENK
jgi:hypothetical protein